MKQQVLVLKSPNSLNETKLPEFWVLPSRLPISWRDQQPYETSVSDFSQFQRLTSISVMLLRMGFSAEQNQNSHSNSSPFQILLLFFFNLHNKTIRHLVKADELGIKLVNGHSWPRPVLSFLLVFLFNAAKTRALINAKCPNKWTVLFSPIQLVIQC